jgi:hypothetical protein
MSKLKALIAIPIALLGVKRLQKTVIDDPNPKSIIPTTAPDRPKQRDDGTFFGL